MALRAYQGSCFAQLWVYETLLQHFQATLHQPFPKINFAEDSLFLAPTPLIETPDYSVLDLILKEAEDGCAICFRATAVHTNPISFCEECGTGVHALCYGENLNEDID